MSCVVQTIRYASQRFVWFHVLLRRIDCLQSWNFCCEQKKQSMELHKSVAFISVRLNDVDCELKQKLTARVWGYCRVKVPKKSPSICMWMVWTLATLQTFNFLIRSTIGGGKGRQCAGAAFGGAKIWNYDIWLFLANWHLHDGPYFTLLTTSNTPPVLGPHPQLSVHHDPTQSSVYTKKLTLVIWLIIHLL